MDTALREHPEIVKKYLATIIPVADNKFAALNSAVWSGGSFVYVPKGVEVKMPLQAYFRINTENMGQFERTLIIADEGSKVHYIEGCTAPQFSTSSLHSAVVELIAMEGASIRYTTIQNWYRNIYNLVTKRAVAYKNATVEWVDGNIGSKLTMKYPAIYLMGEGARGEILSAAFAGEGQHQDAGAKVIHAAPNTTSVVTNKSVTAHGGKTTYRGLVEIHAGAVGAKTRVKCDALIMDDQSSSDTKPTMKIDEQRSTVEHEASVSKIGEEQLFYAMSRGLTEADATAMIVNGFFDFFVKELPMEYAVELNRLIKMEMEGSVGSGSRLKRRAAVEPRRCPRRTIRRKRRRVDGGSFLGMIRRARSLAPRLRALAGGVARPIRPLPRRSARTRSRPRWSIRSSPANARTGGTFRFRVDGRRHAR